jgi:hypothetical protein
MNGTKTKKEDIKIGDKMEKMNKLGTLKKCPKCYGARNMELFYIRHIPKEEKNDTLGNLIGFEDEYMEIQCTNCGYIEKELPVDFYKEKSKSSCEKLKEWSEKDIATITNQCGKTLLQANMVKECVEEYLKHKGEK